MISRQPIALKPGPVSLMPQKVQQIVRTIPSRPAQMPVTRPAPMPVQPKPNPFIKPEDEKPTQKEIIVERPKPQAIVMPDPQPKKIFQPSPIVKIGPQKPINVVMPAPKPIVKIGPQKPINVIQPAPRPAPKPIMVQDPRPSPPTSIRRPNAIPSSPIRRSMPRVYSQNRRVSFRAARLNITKPTARKPAWTPYPPAKRSFMPRVRPGQFSLSPRSNDAFRARMQAAEIKRLKKQVNTLNQDALKTKQEYAAEREALKADLEHYSTSPFFTATSTISKNTKGAMEVFDTGAKLVTPSVNGIGAIGMGEGASKLAAAGMGLFALLFLIGRVE